VTQAPATKPAAQAGTEDAAPILDKLLARDIRVPITDGKAKPDTLEAYQRMARMYLMAGIVPTSLTKNKNEGEQIAGVVVVLMQSDLLGIPHVQGLSGMMVVNNRVAMWGDLIPALLRSSGKFGPIEERIEGDGDGRVAVCRLTRYHKTPDGKSDVEIIERRFSVEDAKIAKLWGKKGYEGKDTPWVTNPTRMLQMRARAFAARDGGADVLMGLRVAEEELDIEPEQPKPAKPDPFDEINVKVVKAVNTAGPRPVAAQGNSVGESTTTSASPSPAVAPGSGAQDGDGLEKFDFTT